MQNYEYFRLIKKNPDKKYTTEVYIYENECTLHTVFF